MPKATELLANDSDGISHMGSSSISSNFYSLKVIYAVTAIITAVGTTLYCYYRNNSNVSDSSNLRRQRQERCPVSGAAHATGDIYGHSSSVQCPFGLLNSKCLPSNAQPHGRREGVVINNNNCHVRPSQFESQLLPPLTELYPTPSPFTANDLSKCTGTKSDGSSTMVCISVKGIVYRVTPQFYGPGEPYEVYAGKDVTVPLLKSSVSDRWANYEWRGELTGNCYDGNKYRPPCTPFLFTADELRTLDLWEEKFIQKYDVVGWYVPFERMDESEMCDLEGKNSISSTTNPLVHTTSPVVLCSKKEAIEYVRRKIGSTTPRSISE